MSKPRFEVKIVNFYGLEAMSESEKKLKELYAEGYSLAGFAGSSGMFIWTLERPVVELG